MKNACLGSNSNYGRSGAHWVKQRCPLCGRKVSVRRSGRMYAHQAPKHKVEKRLDQGVDR